MRNAILTISSAAKTATSGKFGAVLKSTLFAVLLAAASMAGAVPIPGTPVPITLQTFVVMLAALMLPWKQAGAAVLMYLAAGAAGLPVFAGGASTMALVGPSAGLRMDPTVPLVAVFSVVLSVSIALRTIILLGCDCITLMNRRLSTAE
ncbi:MAG: biotin transporter BioY, partial [Bifidobacterium adolescentis]